MYSTYILVWFQISIFYYKNVNDSILYTSQIHWLISYFHLKTPKYGFSILYDDESKKKIPRCLYKYIFYFFVVKSESAEYWISCAKRKIDRQTAGYKECAL